MTLHEIEAIADERREITLDQAKALPGLLGRLATTLLGLRGWYGYTDVRSGHTILLVLAR
jgi:hypothetical protein